MRDEMQRFHISSNPSLKTPLKRSLSLSLDLSLSISRSLALSRTLSVLVLARRGFLIRLLVPRLGDGVAELDNLSPVEPARPPFHQVPRLERPPHRLARHMRRHFSA